MMTDNQLIQLFFPIIQTGLVTNGFPNVIVKQANQPTQQGVNTGPTVYFFKVSSKRYGFLGRKDRWDSDAETMIHTESQYYETTFQVSALVQQNPKTPNQYTASDLVNEVASILQSDNTIDTFNESGIGILRVTDLVNPYFVDDRDQFEASPSFDFVLISQASRVSIDPVIELPVGLNIQGV
jgi:hypothetical protein